MQNQRYETICLRCLNENKGRTRDINIRDGDDNDEKETAKDDWGPIYLSESTYAILMVWYRKAQNKVWGKTGRRRTPVSIDDSDHERDNIPADWLVARLELTRSSRAIAVRWLRTARARLQRRGEE